MGMKTAKGPKAANRKADINVRFSSLAHYELVKKAAKKLGISINKFITRVALRDADAVRCGKALIAVSQTDPRTKPGTEKVA